MRAIGRSLRGIGAAVRSRPWFFAAVALGVFALDILVPPLVLSLARKSVSAFTINPWLPGLPDYLVSGRGSLGERAALAVAPWGRRAGGSGGVLGALGGIFGLSTGGCTVMGCGAPVLPVIGLAFVGLSSTTITWMSDLSTIGTAAGLIGLGSAVP